MYKTFFQREESWLIFVIDHLKLQFYSGFHALQAIFKDSLTYNWFIFFWNRETKFPIRTDKISEYLLVIVSYYYQSIIKIGNCYWVGVTCQAIWHITYIISSNPHNKPRSKVSWSPFGGEKAEVARGHVSNPLSPYTLHGCSQKETHIAGL